MRGYPKHINTKQDLDNLLTIPEFKGKALADMKRLQAKAVAEAKVIRVVSGSEEEGNLITEEIDNPSPTYIKMGFKDKKELDDLVSVKDAEIKEVVLNVK